MKAMAILLLVAAFTMPAFADEKDKKAAKKAAPARVDVKCEDGKSDCSHGKTDKKAKIKAKKDAKTQECDAKAKDCAK